MNFRVMLAKSRDELLKRRERWEQRCDTLDTSNVPDAKGEENMHTPEKIADKTQMLDVFRRGFTKEFIPDTSSVSCSKIAVIDIANCMKARIYKVNAVTTLDITDIVKLTTKQFFLRFLWDSDIHEEDVRDDIFGHEIMEFLSLLVKATFEVCYDMDVDFVQVFRQIREIVLDDWYYKRSQHIWERNFPVCRIPMQSLISITQHDFSNSEKKKAAVTSVERVLRDDFDFFIQSLTYGDIDALKEFIVSEKASLHYDLPQIFYQQLQENVSTDTFYTDSFLQEIVSNFPEMVEVVYLFALRSLIVELNDSAFDKEEMAEEIHTILQSIVDYREHHGVFFDITKDGLWSSLVVAIMEHFDGALLSDTVEALKHLGVEEENIKAFLQEQVMAFLDCRGDDEETTWGVLKRNLSNPIVFQMVEEKKPELIR